MMTRSLSGASSRATATVPFTGAPVCEFTIVPEMEVELLPLVVVPLPPLEVPDPELAPAPELAPPPELVPPLLLPPLDPVAGGAVEAAGVEGCPLLIGLLAVPPQPMRDIATANNKDAPNREEGGSVPDFMLGREPLSSSQPRRSN